MRKLTVMLAIFAATTLSVAAQSAHNPFSRVSSTSSSAFFNGIARDAKVIVQVVQRKLDGMLGDVARDLSSGVAVHTQVIVKDANGKILEAIGYFSDGKGTARQDNAALPYDAEQLFQATCSYADYINARNRIVGETAEYSAIALSRTRKNDPDRKMSLEVWEQNCQAFAEALSAEVAKQQTAEVQKEFRHPGNQVELVTKALKAAGVVIAGKTEKEASVINTATAIDPNPVQPIQTHSGIVNPVLACQTQTIDNRALKQLAFQQLDGAYQYASGVADEAGVSAEYQSTVSPVMSQGRTAISTLPDHQTGTVPTAAAQGGGLPMSMEEFGKTFAEQGPCAAGLQLEVRKNQNAK